MVTFPGASVAENEWECTELVKRYLYLAYGVTSLGSTNGDQVVANYASTYPSYFQAINNQDGSNNTNHVWPSVGDVLSYSDVHTAIIIGVNVTDRTNGNATLTLLEQNASATGTTTQQFVGWKIKGDIDDPSASNSDTVSGWLKHIWSWSDISPSGTSDNAITSMASSNSTNIWAAGYERAVSGPRQPVTYKYDGTSWTKISPPSLGSSSEHELYGITSDSSGNIWTVGQVYQSLYNTLVYNWNGSAWVHKNSDNPSTGYNNLTTVSMDNSGDIYTAGTYYDGTTYQPLVEKWNGTKFAQETLSTPSGCNGGELYGISVNSSTDVWAVGNMYCSSTNVYVIFHYDGTMWTSTTGSSFSNLYSVKAVSANEAWAVGTKSSAPLRPFILHYTTSGGWQEDTSFSFSNTYSSWLYSVDADNANNVWIVGQLDGNSWSMHYDGASWSHINTPSLTSPVLSGVTVSSSSAWAGGAQGSSPLPMVFKAL